MSEVAQASLAYREHGRLPSRRVRPKSVARSAPAEKDTPRKTLPVPSECPGLGGSWFFNARKIKKYA